MSDRAAEILSAFLDGEPVETAELTDALSTPDARETMIDYIVMRSAIVDEGDSPSSAFYDRMERQLEPPRTTSKRRWLSLAAAAVVVLALSGLWLTRQTPIPDSPPEPTRVLHLERGIDWHGNG